MADSFRHTFQLVEGKADSTARLQPCSCEYPRSQTTDGLKERQGELRWIKLVQRKDSPTRASVLSSVAEWGERQENATPTNTDLGEKTKVSPGSRALTAGSSSGQGARAVPQNADSGPACLGLSAVYVLALTLGELLNPYSVIQFHIHI